MSRIVKIVLNDVMQDVEISIEKEQELLDWDYEIQLKEKKRNPKRCQSLNEWVEKEKHEEELEDRRWREHYVSDRCIDDEGNEISILDKLSSYSDEDVFANERFEKALEIAKSVLTERQYIIFYMYVVEGMTYEEIGKELNITKVAIGYSYKDSIKKLQKCDELFALYGKNKVF